MREATVLDAANAGYKVTVIEGLCKGVAPETTAKALEEMKAKGITVKKELESQILLPASRIATVRKQAVRTWQRVTACTASRT